MDFEQDIGQSACYLRARSKKREGLMDVPFDQLKKLWTLNLIVKTGSLKKAALQSKVSPSAISQTLSALERSIGHPLIIRNRGSAEPTPVCIDLLNSVAPAFDLLEKLGDPKESVVPKLAYINIGTYESLAIDLFPKFVGFMREENPQARVNVFTARTGQLLTMVRKGELCSALVVDNGNLDRFFRKVIYEDRLGIYIKKGVPVNWADVQSGQLGVLRGGSDGVPTYLSRFMKLLGPSFRPVFTSDSMESLRELARTGQLPTVLPHKVAMRVPDELEEITPKDIPERDLGHHKITLISQQNCDVHETNYIVETLNKTLS